MSIYNWYMPIKTLHMSCVSISVALFAARGAWVLGTRRRLWRWLKIAPHLIDTVLLASGLTLAILLQQYPFYNSAWLTAKVVGLIAYIALGMWVFKSQATRATRWSIWVMALIVFAYIVSVAITKHATGFINFLH